MTSRPSSARASEPPHLDDRALTATDHPAMLRARHSTMATQELIGRDPQLEDLAVWLGDPSRLPAARVVEGEPGIGKTSLVRAAVVEAERLGYRVLAASPVEPEARLAYAAL